MGSFGLRSNRLFIDGFGRSPGPHKPRIEEAFRHFLNSYVFMGTQPAIVDHAVFETAMLGRQVIPLTHIGQANARLMLARNRKPDSIPFPFLRQSRAIAGVSEIAMVKLVSGRDCSVRTRSRAIPIPARSERQAGRMNPHRIF